MGISCGKLSIPQNIVMDTIIVMIVEIDMSLFLQSCHPLLYYLESYE